MAWPSCVRSADFEFQRIERMENELRVLDLLHTNSIEFMRRPELEARSPIYSRNNVLVSIRHQDSVALFDWKQYRGEAEGFFRVSQGSSQRLPNGNTLLANSNSGEAFEVTPEGEVVWRFLNPASNAEEKRATFVRIKRYPLKLVDRLLDREGDVLPP